MRNFFFRDRFLFSILGGIGVLILVALILFVVRQGKVDYQSDTTPEGVLHNYFLAIQKHDYQRAYSYLADSPEKPEFTQFQQPFVGNQGSEIMDAAVEIGSVSLNNSGETAVVQVFIIRSSRDVFGSSYRSQESATLVKANNTWKVSQAPYPYWGYNWWNKPIPPAPAVTLTPVIATPTPTLTQ